MAGGIDRSASLEEFQVKKYVMTAAVAFSALMAGQAYAQDS